MNLISNTKNQLLYAPARPEVILPYVNSVTYLRVIGRPAIHWHGLHYSTAGAEGAGPIVAEVA